MSPDEGSGWDADLFARQLHGLGERARAIRKSRGWSQGDVDERTRMGRRKVWAVEDGRQNLTLKGLWRLANVFQMHWADLVDDRTTDPPHGSYPSVPFDRQLAAFATRVYQARVLQRLSQQALTDRTGVGRAAIAEIEDGTENITLKTLSRLAAGLGLHWADLLDDRQATPPQLHRPREDDPVLQAVAEKLADAFDRYDQPYLAELSTILLNRHLYARRLLSDYLDQMWTDAQQHQSLNPAAPKPEWTSIAALRHLTHHLLATAQDERTRRD